MIWLVRFSGRRLRPPGFGPARRRKAACRQRRRRLAAIVSSLTAVALGIATACALLVPGLAPEVKAAQPGPSPVTTQPSLGQGSAFASVASSSPLVVIPWGSGPGQVGLSRPTEGLAEGPQSLAVAADGRIAVLDSVNHRIVELDSKGAVTGTVAVPLTEARFLAVTADRLYALDSDSDGRLLVMDWGGQMLASVPVPALDQPVTGLFATDRGPCLELAHEHTYLLQVQNPVSAASSAQSDEMAVGGLAPGTGGSEGKAQMHEIRGRPLGRDLGDLVSASFKRGQAPQLKFSKTPKGGVDASPAGESQLGLPGGFDLEYLVSIDGDGHGGMVVGAHILGRSGQTKQPALLVAHLRPTSGAASTTAGAASMVAGSAASQQSAFTTSRSVSYLVLADSTYAYVGQPYTVGPDGCLYQPMATEAGYSILVHSFADSAVNAAMDQGGAR
jgi:hypothetical protein